MLTLKILQSYKTCDMVCGWEWDSIVARLNFFLYDTYLSFHMSVIIIIQTSKNDRLLTGSFSYDAYIF